MLKTLLVFILGLTLSIASFAQNATIVGIVIDEQGVSIVGANVAVVGTTTGTSTDNNGGFSLSIPAQQSVLVQISFVGREPMNQTFNLISGTIQTWNVILKQKDSVIDIVEIVDQADREVISLQKIDPINIIQIPNTTGGVEAIIKTLPGVVSNNELSSTYSVRGGNYDENLVYVNDFEIFRPFLIRSGQQEGLSFLNPDMVSSIAFSAGGFQAAYGDKMSSVLDIKYAKADSFGGSLGLSLLGANLHMHGLSKSRKLSYSLGLRQKQNQYLLNGLETDASYNPSFTDVQGFFTYDIGKKADLEILGNYSRNKYEFIPEQVVSTTGIVNQVLQLRIFFDGAERDSYESAFGGLALNLKPNDQTRLRFQTSAYLADETEAFDITGEYWLQEVETDLGQDNFGEPVNLIGVGTFHDWARNNLETNVYTAEHKGVRASENHFWSWGLKFQREEITDRLSEWILLDSSGFNLPFSNDEINFQEVIKTDADLSSNRYSAYLQDELNLDANDMWKMNIGARLSYWDINEELLVSPRLQLSFNPLWENNDVVFRGAIGSYNQPPFYRELRNRDGDLNLALEAQKSYQVVLGSDWNLDMWNRPFKLTTEVYYKHLYDLVPYDLDNIRIRYFGENKSEGYAAGIDMRLFGEFVPGTDSWVSVSFLKTEEDITGDGFVDSLGNFIEIGQLARPTDQRFNFGMFFQDYLRSNENIKVFLNFLYGTGLPFSPPQNEQFRNALRVPDYRRVDIGFSAQLFNKEKHLNKKGFVGGFDNIWVSLEVFNLLGVSNTIAYTWVNDTNNTQYAVPQRLTDRRPNFKMYAKF